MADRTELERLSSEELHDRAVKLAQRRLDVKFLWSLLQRIPAAEAAAHDGDPRESEADISHVSALLWDALHSGEGKHAEALRPFYLDYIAEHGS
jgi:hypothetical protein